MKVILCQGLPASSKSTWAKKKVLEDGNIFRINRDDLREMLFSSQWTPKREEVVVKSQMAIAESIVSMGHGIIIDDTNLKSHIIDIWKDFANQKGAKFEIQSFLDVDIDECIRRDSLREKKVGRPVIENMALRNGLIDFSIYEKWACIDIDGTISLLGERRNFVTNGNKDWNSFFNNVHLDIVNEEVRKIMNDAKSGDFGIILLSGRPMDKCGISTVDWLSKNNIKYDRLFMRQSNDCRSDVVIKDEIFQLLPKNKIKLVVDDRRCMIKYWNDVFKNTDTLILDVGDGTEY